MTGSSCDLKNAGHQLMTSSHTCLVLLGPFGVALLLLFTCHPVICEGGQLIVVSPALVSCGLKSGFQSNVALSDLQWVIVQLM